MSLYIESNNNYNKELKHTYRDRFTVDYISDRKYGDYTTIEKDLNSEGLNNKLIEVEDLVKIGYISTSYKDKYRINQLLELEDDVSKICKEYTYTRIDLYPDNDIDIKDDDYVLLINEFESRLNTDRFYNEVIVATVGNIELSNKDIWHLHFGMFINLDIIDKDHYTSILDSIYLLFKDCIMTVCGEMYNSSLNMVDMSEIGSEDRLYVIKSDDYISRNNCRGLLSYHCKNSMSENTTVSVYEDRTCRKLFYTYLKEIKEEIVLSDDWYKTDKELLDIKHLEFIRSSYSGNVFVDYRVEKVFEFESKIFTEYDKYRVFIFRTEGYTHTEMLNLLAEFNKLKITKIFEKHMIGYNWGIVFSGGIWIMEWAIFYSVDIDDQDIENAYIPVNMIQSITKTFTSSNKDIRVIMPDPVDVINIPTIVESDILARNIVRYDLVKLTFTSKDTKDFLNNSSGMRCFGQSRL